MSAKWNWEHHVASASAIHGLGLPAQPQRTVRTIVANQSALVLGSTQPDADANHDEAQRLGIEIVRRRSGGGAVLVERDDLIWLDVLIPSNDSLWSSDVGQAFYWVGDAVAAALSHLEIEGIDVYRGPLVTTPWSRQICFAGLGPGECTRQGKKIVGISQRRTRSGSLFQIAIVKRFDLDTLARLLTVSSKAMVEDVEPVIGQLPELDDAAFLAAFRLRLDQL